MRKPFGRHIHLQLNLLSNLSLQIGHHTSRLKEPHLTLRLQSNHHALFQLQKFELWVASEEGDQVLQLDQVALEDEVCEVTDGLLVDAGDEEGQSGDLVREETRVGGGGSWGTNDGDGQVG